MEKMQRANAKRTIAKINILFQNLQKNFHQTERVFGGFSVSFHPKSFLRCTFEN